MTRREILVMAGAAPAWFSATSPLRGAQQGKTRLGGAVEAFHLRAQGSGGGGRPFDMVEHCHQLGLGGVQTSLVAVDPDSAKELRKRVEGYQPPSPNPHTLQHKRRHFNQVKTF